ncbi:MAG: hypothetical protein Q4A64_02305 [Porphyromonadaceae bacterium]|nr:hypothetical protein [Porphyromonadaceae bacterium]
MADVHDLFLFPLTSSTTSSLYRGAIGIKSNRRQCGKSGLEDTPEAKDEVRANRRYLYLLSDNPMTRDRTNNKTQKRHTAYSDCAICRVAFYIHKRDYFAARRRLATS